jgi:hypothetical protein
MNNDIQQRCKDNSMGERQVPSISSVGIAGYSHTKE